jgi:hypothetical protein
VFPPGRASRQGPRNRAAEKRDELASSQLIELHSIATSQGRIAGYRIGNGQSAGAGVILQPVSAEDHGGVRSAFIRPMPKPTINQLLPETP